MKRQLLYGLLLLSFVLLPGCQNKKNDFKLLTREIARYYSSIGSKDYNRKVSYYNDDAMLMPNNATLIKGKSEIAKFLGDTSYVFKIKERRAVEISMSDDMAYIVNNFKFAFYLKGGIEEWHNTKSLHVWKKNSSGDWKIQVDIWNSNEIKKFSELDL